MVKIQRDQSLNERFVLIFRGKLAQMLMIQGNNKLIDFQEAANTNYQKIN